MGFFEKNKALLITVLLFSILLLAMVNIRLANSKEEITTTLIDLASLERIDTEEAEEEDSEVSEPSPVPPTASISTHQAYNQDQQQSENLESRLKDIFEKNSAKSTASEIERTATNSGEANLSKNTSEEQKGQSDGVGTSEEESIKTASLRNSTISFSLVDRSALRIPNPIYTCADPGKVVVNIKVNTEGTVIDTSINQASSTTKNECLLEKALEYAEKAAFSPLAGRNAQPGTITYNFQG